MSLDTKLATRLHERLTEIETGAVIRMTSGVPLAFESYHQSRGFLEAVRQMRDALLPEIVQTLQEE